MMRFFPKWLAAGALAMLAMTASPALAVLTIVAPEVTHGEVPPNPTTGFFDVYLTIDPGDNFNMGSYSARLQMSGGGSQIRMTGASLSGLPQSFNGAFFSANLDGTGTTLDVFDGLLSGTVAIPDNYGLFRVFYEVDSGTTAGRANLTFDVGFTTVSNDVGGLPLNFQSGAIVIPEPSSVALLGMPVLAGVGYGLRRRKLAKKSA